MILSAKENAKQGATVNSISSNANNFREGKALHAFNSFYYGAHNPCRFNSMQRLHSTRDGPKRQLALQALLM